MKIFIISVIVALITSCSYSQPAPVYYQPAPAVYKTQSTSKFNQSWSAALGALSDQGVRITTQDRDAGIIQGSRYGIEVTASIRPQANNSVRVEFNTSGDTKSDPALIKRITGSYNSRMGR